jgi:hypothetical protein
VSDLDVFDRVCAGYWENHSQEDLQDKADHCCELSFFLFLSVAATTFWIASTGREIDKLTDSAIGSIFASALSCFYHLGYENNQERF